MIVNKSSLHYRFWERTYAGATPPTNTNLCRYVRRIVLAGIFATALASYCAVLTGYVLYGVLYHGFYLHTKIAFIVLGILAALASMVAAIRYERKRRAERLAEEPKKREPSLLRQWLSAKKQKVCPLVEFK